MYACIVRFIPNGNGPAIPTIVSDGKPMKSVRKFVCQGDAIVVRAETVGNEFNLRIQNGGLLGEVLFEGVVPDGKRIRVGNMQPPFWTVAVSAKPVEPDVADVGTFVDEDGIETTALTVPCYEGRPSLTLDELARPVSGETPRTRMIEDLRDSDIRCLKYGHGGFFSGYYETEAWLKPDGLEEYNVRFWHELGPELSPREAKALHPRESISKAEMQSLVDDMLDLGLLEAYSIHEDSSIVDGSSWSLSIEAMDGYRWMWSGYSVYPAWFERISCLIDERLLGKKSERDFHEPCQHPSQDEGLLHLYLHGYRLKVRDRQTDLHGDVLAGICASIRQDLILFRNGTASEGMYYEMDARKFSEVVERNGLGASQHREIGEITGAIGYIVDHDDACQHLMRRFVLDGVVESLLCAPSVAEKIAPAFSETGWEYLASTCMDTELLL